MSSASLSHSALFCFSVCSRVHFCLKSTESCCIIRSIAATRRSIGLGRELFFEGNKARFKVKLKNCSSQGKRAKLFFKGKLQNCSSIENCKICLSKIIVFFFRPWPWPWPWPWPRENCKIVLQKKITLYLNYE